MKSVTIGNSVTEIRGDAFSECSNLKSVIIGDGVTSIGDWVFNNCINLKSIVLFPVVPPALGQRAIPTTISKIYVQKSSEEEYKANPDWNAFMNNIESNNTYLSLIRFNIKNKEYIKASISITDTSTVTIATSAWSNNSAVVSVKGVTSSNNIFVTPSASSYIAYANAQVRCTAQGSGTLTFTCETTPTTAITVNILIFNS